MNGIRWFDEIGIGDVRSVGGKNASLAPDQAIRRSMSRLAIRETA